MSATPHHDLLQPGLFSGSEQMSASRLPASSRDPSSSKRVCFYKSGDPQFAGHRVVINSRTFKTFDALLDALSKKVPLPFGVRTITTPKGAHAVRSLDDLQDGASYVCSDQRRVKPLNMDEISRRQVPWNTTGPTSLGQQGRRGLIRQLMKKNEVRRAAKLSDRIVAVWTPKRLVVYKNRDPSIRRIIVLQKRTAPTFEALLDYLSQVLQFPVGKLFTADGRRVDGLPSLIMCSGIVVAAGNEPFSMGNYSLQGSSQLSQSAISESLGPARTQALPSQKKSPGSTSRSRHFSLSSERYFVDQINKSLNGSLSEDNGRKTGSIDTEKQQPLESEGVETTDSVAVKEEKVQFIMPSEDDIEKSFVVNQDGSMTVEMKVHLTLKHEEMIHWTTTLSRICLKSQQRAVCSQLGYNSPETKTYPAMRNNYESSEDYTSTQKSEGLNKAGEDHCGSVSSEAMDKPKPALRRPPTPGPKRVRKNEASVGNIKVVSQNEVKESTVGAYSYMEHTAEGELTEGYCVVSRSSSSSTRPVPKPRKSSSEEAKHKKTNSSIRSSRIAEVLQLQNNGSEITETVMHIYESQGVCENYFANTHVSAEKSLEFRTNTKQPRKLDSTDSGPQSSSYDCDVDLTRQNTSSDSQNARKKELLSLSSGQSSSSQKINNNLASCTNNEKRARPKFSDKGLVNHEACTKENPGEKRTDNRKTKMTPKSVKSKEGLSDKKLMGNVPDSLKDLTKSKSPESQCHTGSEKKAVSSAGSDQICQKIKKKKKDKQSSESDQNLEKEASPKNVKKCDNVSTRDSCQTDTRRSPIKKKHLDVLVPSHLAPFRMLAKPRSMNEWRTKSPEENKELTESISLPALHSSPSNVHQYVENWLKKIQPESVPYMDEMDPHEAETAARPTFWIGSGSADSSEMRSEPEQDSAVKERASLEDTTAERSVCRPPVEIRCEGEPVETQRIRGFCKSMPSVRIHPAEQESHLRMNKSLGALVTAEPDAEGETSQSTKVNTTSSVKPALKQLCLSIQSLRRTASNSNLTSFEKKSSSVPDFSSQVASVFGAPSKALLSFLSLMTLKDGISSPGNKDTRSKSGSYPEALQVMQSLEKIANIEDEEQLKVSLTSLQSSTSSQLKKSWRDFQERNETEASPPLSPRQSEQEFALEVDSEGEDHYKEHNFGLKELMDELNMSEDLRREISSLVDGEQTSTDKKKLTKNYSSKAFTDNASANEDGAMKDDFLEGEGGFLEDKASQDDLTRPVEGVSLPEELHSMDPCTNLSIEEFKNVQTVKNEAHQTDQIKHAPEIEDNVQPSEVKYTEDITCQENELEVPDATQSNVEEEEKKEEEEEDTELHAYNLDTDGVNVSQHNLEVKYGQDCETDREKGDESEEGDDRKKDLDEQKINAEEEDIYQKTREYTEQPEAEDINATSEAEHSGIDGREEHELDNNQEAVDADVQHRDLSTDNCIPHMSQDSQDSEFGNEGLPLEIHSDYQNIYIGEKEEENTKDLEDAPTDALDCSADDVDLGNNHNGPMEEEHDNDKECAVSKASEYESQDSKSHHSSMSGQEGEQSDKTEKGSCQSQESESEHNELQTLQKKGCIEIQNSAEEKYDEADEHEDEDSNALDSNKDSDSELEVHSPATSDQESKNYNQNRLESCKSQESDVLQMSDEERTSEKCTSSVEEKDEETDLAENKHCHTLDSEEDYEMEPEQEGTRTRSSKSQESEAEHELQTLEEVDATEEEKGEDFNAGPETIDSAISDQEREHSDQDKEPSCKSHGSEVEHVLQTLEEGSVTEENEEVDEHEDEQSDALDSEKDFDSEPEAIGSTVSDQAGEHSDQDKGQSSKSQESEDEQELNPLEEGNDSEDNDGQVDEAEDKDNNALDYFDSVKDFEEEQDANSQSAMSDQDDKHYEQNKPRACKSQGSDSDVETEAEYPADSDQVAELFGQVKARHDASQSKESDDEQEPPAKVQESICKTPEEHKDMEQRVDKQSNTLDLDKDVDAQSDYSYMQDPEIKHSLWQEPCKNQVTEAHPAQSDDFEGVEKADVGNDCYCVHPMEISQELLDFVNLALLSSALTFTHDSNGHMRIEPDQCKITEICDDHYIRRCLPSPNMSDLSDYRPETSDSGGNVSHNSSDLYTETADEEVEKLSFYKGNVRQTSKNIKRCDKALDNNLTENKLGSHSKTIDSPSSNSTNSLPSFQDSKANGSIQESASYSNTPGSLNGDSGPIQQIAFHSGVDSSEGILIDKGRWLLKENHLIRRSPPVPMAMYENADTTSADTGQDNTSEDALYPACGSQHSPLAAISSSELEEMTKPPTPKCTYFNMPHSSDSDPFRDNQSVNSSKAGDVRKSRELKVCPLGETSKTLVKKNGSLPSFASVEFKLPDGKVHPEGGLASGAVEKTARSENTSSRAAQEEESVEELNLRCGRHCPIL